MRFAIYREIQYTKPFTIPNYDIGMIRELATEDSVFLPTFSQ